MSKKAVDNFENGFFWELYNDLERQFQNFLEYVPYLPGNETVYSFKLLNLIVGFGGHIDSAFKEMARYSKFSENEGCRKILERASERKGIISTGVDAFDDIYGISTKKVGFKRLIKRKDIIPFSCDEEENHVPKWWKFYNDLKHDVGINIREANLKNTRDALAGAFLLNVIHKPAILRLNDYGVLKWPPEPIEGEFAGVFDHALVRVPRHTLEEMLESNQDLWAFVETPLFIYDHSQYEGNEDE
jgi:hypothetical protein